MKRFKAISISFIAIIAVIFCCNIYYLASLYRSIRSDVERQVMTAIADADIDDMWERSDRNHRAAIAAQKAAGIPGDTLITERQGEISGVKDENGNFITSSTGKNGEKSVRKNPLRRDRSYTNQMVNEMSQQMHETMDPYVDFNLAIMDSILLERLADRHIYPDFLAVEVVGADGEIIRGNAHSPKGMSGYDEFSLCFNPESGLRYRAYMTPLTRHILSEMAGVIVTIFLLMATFTMAFIYLFRTVSKLRTLEEMKDDFVSNMTHELKTPIAIAYSANDALLNYGTDRDPAKRETYLTIANRQLKRLGELVENILAMSMERRKTMQFKPETIHLRQFIEDIAAAQRMRSDKPIEIETESDPALTVEADKSHLSNVLNNLIDNAIKYSGESVRISVKCSHNGISVTDNGIGIPAKSIPFLFNKFYRVPNGNIQEVRGYGIGLYYVRSILDKMGWSINVRSREGEGSVFIIKFRNNES